MIRTDYLSDAHLFRFDLIKSDITRKYERVIEQIRRKSVLPYIPTIYITPFMLVIQYRLHSRLARVVCYAVTYPDADNFDKLAIYVTLSVLEKYPEYATGILAHELAHVMALKGRAQITRAAITSMLRDKSRFIKAREKRAENFYKYFPDDIRVLLREWDALSDREDIGENVAKDAQTVNIRLFEELVFGAKLNEYHKYVRSKLSNIGFEPD